MRGVPLVGEIIVRIVDNHFFKSLTRMSKTRMDVEVH